MSAMVVTPAFTILVVDECPAVRQFVSLAVGSDEVQVLGATDGAAALECLDRMRPALVMLSAGDNGLGGRALIAAVRERGVPLVLVAGALDPERATLDAADAVLARPLQVEPLRDLVAGLKAQQDPVGAWLETADLTLGSVPGWWARACAEAGFAGDVTALRSADTRERLVIAPLQYTD